MPVALRVALACNLFLAGCTAAAPHGDPPPLPASAWTAVRGPLACSFAVANDPARVAPEAAWTGACPADDGMPGCERLVVKVPEGDELVVIRPAPYGGPRFAVEYREGDLGYVAYHAADGAPELVLQQGCYVRAAFAPRATALHTGLIVDGELASAFFSAPNPGRFHARPLAEVGPGRQLINARIAALDSGEVVITQAEAPQVILAGPEPGAWRPVYAGAEEIADAAVAGRSALVLVAEDARSRLLAVALDPVHTVRTVLETPHHVGGLTSDGTRVYWLAVEPQPRDAPMFSPPARVGVALQMLDLADPAAQPVTLARYEDFGGVPRGPWDGRMHPSGAPHLSAGDGKVVVHVRRDAADHLILADAASGRAWQWQLREDGRTPGAGERLPAIEPPPRADRVIHHPFLPPTTIHGVLFIDATTLAIVDRSDGVDDDIRRYPLASWTIPAAETR